MPALPFKGDECTSKELKCSDKQMCVPQEMVCDGDFHCPNGDDEKGCSECKGGALFCEPSGKCIPKWKLCDGQKDCDNGVDEMVTTMLQFTIYVSNFMAD
jgi:hypothetical protein